MSKAARSMLMQPLKNKYLFTIGTAAEFALISQKLQNIMQD